jgi:hypothetical protein
VRRALRLLGFLLLLGGTTGSLVCLVLALTDSPRAPRWLDVFLPTYISVTGAFIVLTTSLQKRPAIEWTSADEVPAHLMVTPRQVESTGMSRRMIITAGVVFTGITLNMPSGFYPHFREWGALRKRGVETTGVVTRRVTVRNPATVHYLHYRFKAGRWFVESADDVPVETFRKVTEGEEVPVTYLERRPAIALAMHKRDLTWTYLLEEYWYLLIFFAAPLFFVPALFVVLHRVEQSMLKIARDGRAVVARVVEANRSRIVYEFDGGTGAALIARRKIIGTPRVGDGIVVLHDIENPRQTLAVIAMDEIRIKEPLGPGP